MKRKIILTLSLASLLCLGGLASISSCGSNTENDDGGGVNRKA